MSASMGRDVMRFSPIVKLQRIVVAVIAGLLITSGALGCLWTDVSPDQSTSDTGVSGSGGRINGLGAASDGKTFYAASEWGGLYKSSDTGLTWSFLDGHVPVATWDVEVDPTDAKRVYATSFYDGKVNNLTGISVSNDGGASWIKPPTAVPPVGFCADSWRRNAPAAFGISIDPSDSKNVYIGTNCGLAMSNDKGLTWTFIDPVSTAGHKATTIWDVVVHDGGIIDVCGTDGHWRLAAGAANWQTAGSVLQALNGGRCSIAVSPDEPYVLFAVVGTTIFESDDGGNSWPVQLVNPRPQGRVPFVATNQRDGNAYDLWFGDVRLFSRSCTTPANPAVGGASRCVTGITGDQAANWTVAQQGAHADVGDIAFDITSTVDACPVLFSNDGGVYFNTINASPACHAPSWEQPNKTPHALWLFSMSGFDRPGNAEDLYFGNQDTGAFSSNDAGAINPSVSNPTGADVFDIIGGDKKVVFIDGFWGGAGATANQFPWRLSIQNPGMTGPAAGVQSICPANETQLNAFGNMVNTCIANRGQLRAANYPPGAIVTFKFTDTIAQFSPDAYVIVTGGGVQPSQVNRTFDITANPVTWTALGTPTVPNLGCGIKVSKEKGGVLTTADGPAQIWNNSFYLQTSPAGFLGRTCMGITPDQIWRYDGLDSDGVWRQIHPPGNLPDPSTRGVLLAQPGFGGFSLYDVDPNNPDRIIASHLPPPDPSGNINPRMVMSKDGGSTWKLMPQLDNLMTGGGVFRYHTGFGGPGSANSYWFQGYPQPTLLAFDPRDEDIIAAGGADSGVFITADGGINWHLATDPITPYETDKPHISRPRFAYFDYEDDVQNSNVKTKAKKVDLANIFVGTQGKGAWRLKLEPDLRVTLTGPNSAKAGVDIGPNMNLKVENVGTDVAEDFYIDVVLSTDKVVPPGLNEYSATFHEDVLLAGGRVSNIAPLEPGKSQSYAVGGGIPTDAKPPGYWVCARVDPANQVKEFNENNNLSCYLIKITG